MNSLVRKQGMGLFLILVVFMGFWADPGFAQEETASIPPMTGISLNLGYTYDPSVNIWFSQATFIKLVP